MILRLALGMLFMALSGLSILSADEVTPLQLAADLQNPESVCIGPDGRVFVTVIGEFDKAGDGSVVSIAPGKIQTFASGLDDPKGIVCFEGIFYVTDRDRVVKIDDKGHVRTVAGPDAFPRPPLFLNDVAVDPQGTLYVSDTGDRKGAGGGVFRIAPDGKVTTVLDAKTTPSLKGPNGLLVDGPEHLLMIDFLAGSLHRVKIADGSLTTLIAEGLNGGDGLVRDYDNNLYISQWLTGQVSVLRPGAKQVEPVTGKFKSAADICINYKTGQVVVPDMKGGTVSTVPLVSGNPTSGVDLTPLPVEIAHVWPNVEDVQRPIVVTHAGDGSRRTFVASQLGQVYIMPSDNESSQATLFFDLHERVEYKDRENEEGFLGFAFHPKYKQNGEFFAYYTTREKPHLSIVSRFKVDRDNPNHASAKSEEEILRIPQPFWNHNGGTLAFGPDGYLYIALGDGGAANDPYGHGQNLKTWLGSVLRIDVDKKDAGKQYAVPKDNPFVGKADAQPEIYCYGVRNIWRLSFDRKTGQGWFADVGQDIWEEVNLLAPGANYGWNLRESMHRFGPQGSPPRADLVEPIWEYHHDIGKSVTGGNVYRGSIKALEGHYVYGDYVTGRIWGLRYDTNSRRVTANRPIAGNISPIMSFGEDEAGELYFTTPNHRVYKFVAKK